MERPDHPSNKVDYSGTFWLLRLHCVSFRLLFVFTEAGMERSAMTAGLFYGHITFWRKSYLAKTDSTAYNGSMDRLPAPLEFLTDRRTLAWLLVPVMFLPIGVVILFLFGRVFALLSDTFSASALDWSALALCILWCVSLVLLLLCTAFLLLREGLER